MQVREIMSKDIEVVDRNDNLRTVEERMATKQLRHLPVLEQGEVVGIVTQRDLFKAAMSSTMGYGEKAQQAYLQSVRVKETDFSARRTWLALVWVSARSPMKAHIIQALGNLH
jgi:CBS-domain-containing membrane protein